METLNKNLIPLSIIIAAFIIAGAIFYIFSAKEGPSEGVLPLDTVVQKALDYINQNLLTGDTQAILEESSELGGLYKLKIKIGDQEFESYVSKDGKLLFPEAIVLEEATEETLTQETSQDIPQSERPELKVFVFSYCPYSLQYIKGLFSVVDLLFQKVNIKLMSIGAMHGEHEEIESKRQNCIRGEQPEKYWAYLRCFAYNEGIKECSSKFYKEFRRDEGKMAECLTPYLNECFEKAKIEKSKIIACMKNRADSYYEADMNVAQELKITSSPTPVLNGKILKGVFAGRSPEDIKNAICEGFKTKPSECSEPLSNEISSPGFGRGTSSTESGGCQ